MSRIVSVGLGRISFARAIVSVNFYLSTEKWECDIRKIAKKDIYICFGYIIGTPMANIVNHLLFPPFFYICSGFRYSLREVSRDDIEDAILAANVDPDVDGIIVYYPIFHNRHDQYLQQIVDVSKDVEGLTHRYIFNMYQNIRFLDPDTKRQKCILPCTPLAIIKILEYLNIYNTILPYGNRLFGHTICVVNRSEVVGRPLAALLANDGACVYSVDISGVQKFTRGEGIKRRRHEVVDLEGWSLKDAAPLCDVVISGVPGDKYKFDTSLLRDGAVCVNFSSEKVGCLLLLVGERFKVY